MGASTSVRQSWRKDAADALGLGVYRLDAPKCTLTAAQSPLVLWVGPPTDRIWLLAETLRVSGGAGSLDVEVYQRDCDGGPLLVALGAFAVPSEVSSGTLFQLSCGLCTGWEVRARLSGGATRGELSLAAWVDRIGQGIEVVPGALSPLNT